MLTQTELFLIELAQKSDFIPEEMLVEVRKKLETEGRSDSEDKILDLKFLVAKCPNCGTKGLFKLYPLGRCQHPDCGWSWYINPLRYLGVQVCKAFMRAGRYAGGEVERDKKAGEQGCLWLVLTAIFSFLFAIVFLLPFAIISTLIQMIFYFTQKKVKAKEV